MKKIISLIASVMFCGVLLMTGATAAHAAPSGGWGYGGPVTALGSDEFYGCTNFENFMHATEHQSSYGSGAYALTSLNGNDAVSQFSQAIGIHNTDPDYTLYYDAYGVVAEYE